MNNQTKKVFVTGGNGFIGSHLVDRLVESGYDITVLARESSDLSFLPLEKITLKKGDLRDYKSLENGIQNYEMVFHVAALASDWGKEKDFYEINVNGTKNLLKAAKKNNIQKIILISTAGVLGEEDCSDPKPELASYRPKMPYFLSRLFESDMNHYRLTKMLAEKEAIEFCRENNVDLAVLRPTWVYGPREFNAGPYEFCKCLNEGFRLLPMGLNNRFHVIYVKDLAEAILLSAQKDLKGINIFNIGNEEAPNIRDYFNLYCKYLMIKPPIYVPFWVFYPFGILFEILAKLFRAKRPFLLTRSRVKMFYCNNIYDISKAKEVLGFSAKTSIEQGIKETVSWWKRNGYLQNREMQELKQRYITGFGRLILDFCMGITIFLRYFMLLLKGEISLKQYLIFIKRILILSEVLKYNKAVRINNVYKVHLYLPAWPTKAFYKAIDKFLILDDDTIPSHVVLSMTKACGYNCVHCYQKNDGGQDLSLDKLIKVGKDIQDIGVSLFDIEGGEPLLKFDRLIKLISSLNDRSEIWINTTGHTLTYERALELKKAGLFGAMISIHHWLPDKHDQFVGKRNAFDIACSAIKMFHKAGINTVINCCPSLEMINDSGIEKMMELAKRLNVSFVQVIHEKPAGGWFGRGNTLMDKQILDTLCSEHTEFNKRRKFKNYPSLSMQVFESSPIAFGCTAGGIERFYVNANGEVQPCEFLNVSFGNVHEEEFIDIYKRMRNKFKKPGLKWLCNTECASMVRFKKENNIDSFPIKGKDAINLVDNWDKGEAVPIYTRMRLCEKV